ncbi:MAG: DUF2922 domain-containing protein [Gallicola sp.]|uniref:DUF2922 domain-containing protein n=1 Tax=Gallicola sp. Sow4_E12 TaxID=3438785 RepID=UPI0017A9FB5D|nr:DUF2922 domain-containing protein [Gallicola sp.]
MDQVLELKIANAADESLTLRIQNPKEGLTELEIQTGIQTIANSGVFEKEKGALTIPVSARMIETNYTEFNI